MTFKLFASAYPGLVNLIGSGICKKKLCLLVVKVTEKIKSFLTNSYFFLHFFALINAFSSKSCHFLSFVYSLLPIESIWFLILVIVNEKWLTYWILLFIHIEMIQCPEDDYSKYVKLIEMKMSKVVRIFRNTKNGLFQHPPSPPTGRNKICMGIWKFLYGA